MLDCIIRVRHVSLRHGIDYPVTPTFRRIPRIAPHSNRGCTSASCDGFTCLRSYGFPPRPLYEAGRILFIDVSHRPCSDASPLADHWNRNASGECESAFSPQEGNAHSDRRWVLAFCCFAPHSWMMACSLPPMGAFMCHTPLSNTQ